MYKKALRLTACGLASALLITGSNTTTYAAPVAGVTSAMEVGASNDTLVAGFSLTFSNYMASSELVAKANVATAQNNDTPVVTEGDAATAGYSRRGTAGRRRSVRKCGNCTG